MSSTVSAAEAAGVAVSSKRSRSECQSNDDDLFFGAADSREAKGVTSAPASEIRLVYEEDEPSRSYTDGSQSNKATNKKDMDRNIHDASLQDQIAASALSGTIEFLKLAGGLTLNATGKVVAPPLYVTRTVLLPALWAATVDHISSKTPKRAKDWFRILSSSVHHFVTVLQNTERGQLFRKRLLILGCDLIDCLSADTTRQVLIDGMAGFVKFVEALNTPESKALLDQLAVFFCRLTQVAASGRSQQALHDAKSLVWSGVELLADPSSTSALAEVCAYLCHALEFEDAVLDGTLGNNQQRAGRRKERDNYQRETFQGRTTLMTSPDATVEQVILSSLGSLSEAPPKSCGESDALSHDLQSETEGRILTNDSVSLRKHLDDASGTQEEWHEQAQKNVNVPLLRNRISQRAELLERNDIPRSIPTVSTTEEEEVSPNGPRFVDSTGETSESEEKRSGTEEQKSDGGDALVRFYRVLDKVMKEKRVEGINHILKDYAESADRYIREGKVRKFATNTGTGGEGDQDGHRVAETIRTRVAAIRDEINQGLDKKDRQKLQRMEFMMKRNSWVVYLAIWSVVGLLLLWFGLGCYGIYVLINPVAIKNSLLQSPVPTSQDAWHGGSIHPSHGNEVVIRLVREVVHTDGSGTVLDRAPEKLDLTSKQIEKISSCVGESFMDEYQ